MHLPNTIDDISFPQQHNMVPDLISKQQQQHPSSAGSLVDSAYNSPSSTIDSAINNRRLSSAASRKCCIPEEERPRQTRAPTPTGSTTSSLKQYGECYRRLGEGTSAIVMVFRKLNKAGRTEKLYAIKQFRKRSKNETEKEYMKKLTGEFCISSTFHHNNIVETIDLVLNEQKRYCTVMEYVSWLIDFLCCENARCILIMLRIVSWRRLVLVYHD